MKRYNFIKLCLACLLPAVLGASCSDDLGAPATDESRYEAVGRTFAYVDNAVSPNKRNVDVFHGREATVYLEVGLTRDAARAVEATVAIDPEYLERYNRENGTDYPILPQRLVKLEADGAALIAPGTKNSARIAVTIQGDESLPRDAVYMLPVSIKSVSEGVELSEVQSNYMIVVKSQGERMSTAKPDDLVVISCMEVNDANPLTNGELYLADSGIPFYDIVILFSANINYNEETGRVYVQCNPNVRHILDNKEKYLTPLRDKGIKVVLGILGNHDKSGVANLTRETARYFAKELKMYCDVYELDGIFFDDEYSKYAPGPGFEDEPSYDAAARLVFETKKIMPDRLTMVYEYELTAKFKNKVDGVEPGQFIDYVLADYNQWGDESNYLGLRPQQIASMPQELARGRGLAARPSDIEILKLFDYGAHMLFSMDPYRTGTYNWERQLRQMGYVSQGFFGEDLYWTGVSYEKDW